MAAPSPATYALLGQLATRSWTGYELTQQLRRSVRYGWPTSEAHLYREQKRLVQLGWATVEEESVGDRSRNRYAITEDGRQALRDWLRTTPQEPQLHVEGVVRAFYADRGDVGDLVASMTATAEMARGTRSELIEIALEYLQVAGPMAMLEEQVGGPGDRREFHGRPMFPERLHAVALAIELLTQMLTTVEEAFERGARDVTNWPSATDPVLVGETRRRLERIAAMSDSHSLGTSAAG